MGLSAVLCSEAPARRYVSEALEGRIHVHSPGVEMRKTRVTECKKSNLSSNLKKEKQTVKRISFHCTAAT